MGIIFIDDSNNIIGKVFIFVMGAFLIWAFTLKKTYKTIGYVTLSKDEIIFKPKNGHNQAYSIEKVNDLHLQYFGYQGEWDFFSGSFDSGFGNKLNFQCPNSKHSLEVLLKSYHIKSLRKVIYEWRQKDCDIKVTNFLGTEITL